MEKPVTVTRVEFAETVVRAARESRLPAFILADILKELREQLNAEAEEQYRRDKQAWDAATRQTEAEKETGGSDG